MKFTLSLFALLACLLGAALAKIETEDEVLVITKDNFDEALEKHPYILLEFCEYIYIYRERVLYLYITTPLVRALQPLLQRWLGNISFYPDARARE